MGCDIHVYKEKQIGGRWVSADQWEDEYGDGEDVPYDSRFSGRNYNLFGLLSKGVRKDCEFAFEPRGIPFNVCNRVAAVCERWAGDGHNHSYLYLHELRDMQAYMLTHTTTVCGMKDAAELAALKASIASDSDTVWGLLYPYCGWSNQKDYVSFELEVPSAFMMGDDLKQIIDSFDDIDGENHRIVFWFDN